MSRKNEVEDPQSRRRKAHGRVRMEAVAELAGVSTITVSRFLNHPEKLAKDTRLRVSKAIEKIGYIPNLVAGGLASSRTRMVGIIVPTIVNSIFADTVREIRARVPRCRIEVLIPDFQGNETALYSVLDAGPDVLNHNTETVPRLYRTVRSGGRYSRTLELLDRSRRYAPAIPTKTGLMVGLGEEHDELVSTFKDLRRVGCGILTVGQYI